MARKKSDDSVMTATINFRCDVTLKAALEDLARLSRQDVSSLLVEVCGVLVKENKTRISNFRKSAAIPIKMPTFTPAQKSDAPTVDDVGADENAED